MRENLHRFFRAARGAGVRISPSESMDAMRAVADIGFYDRSVLRDTFLVTLAKSQEEKRLLSDCFDVFFDHPELSQPLADDDSSASSNPEEASESGQAESATGAPSAGLGPTGANASLAGSRRDGSGHCQCCQRRFPVRHPVFHSTRRFLQQDSRPSRNSAIARRSGATGPDQSFRSRAAGRGD